MSRRQRTPHGETIGVPVATIAVLSAETSNGCSTLLGEISRANVQARALALCPACRPTKLLRRLLRPPASRSDLTRRGEKAVVVEQTPRAASGRRPAPRRSPRNPQRHRLQRRNSAALPDGVIVWAPGSIANDAGIAKNNSAVEGVMILGERGIPSAAVSTLTARLGELEHLERRHHLGIIDRVARGVKVGMSAKEAARLMLVKLGPLDGLRQAKPIIPICD
jgi:hypothetical protein